MAGRSASSLVLDVYKRQAPEYLRIGVRHEIVKKLQQRLMDLGFMDNDEPTDYFGEMTQMAVKHFQRQNELPMDGIVGNATWDAIMAEDAKYYAVSKGTQGDDIQRIQQRLYELGYLCLLYTSLGGVLGVSPDDMYIKYEASPDWGWNGTNF